MPKKTVVAPPEPRVVKVTYAYHPANDEPDLMLPLALLKCYNVATTDRRSLTSSALESDIRQNGVVRPLQLRTNGVFGVLTDGSHRLRIATKLDIKELPVQIIPDSLRRVHSQNGFPMLETTVLEWINKDFWSHETHKITRHQMGGGSTTGIASHQYIKCECECGATWREDA